MAAEPRVFVIDRRDVAATGKGSEELTERFCAAAVRELNYNQPEAVSWVCRAALDGGHYVALFRKLRDGKPADRRMTHEATEKAAAAVSWVRTVSGPGGPGGVRGPHPGGR